MFCRFGRLGLSAVLLLGLLLEGVPRPVVLAQTGPDQGPTEPPAERVVISTQGLEKLSPDLRAMVEATPVGRAMGARLLSDAAQDPLLVSALIEPGTAVERFFYRAARSRVIAGQQWVTGEIAPDALRKLASVAGVLRVYSANTFQTAEAPGLAELRGPSAQPNADALRAIVKTGGIASLRAQARRFGAGLPAARAQTDTVAPVQPAGGADPIGVGLLKAQQVQAARSKGIDGSGVVVAVVDTGVDFGHPDLQGTQAVVPAGPYAGWPFAYDTRSAALYALDPHYTIGPDNAGELLGMTQFAHTLPVENQVCQHLTCQGQLALGDTPAGADRKPFSWSDTSKSGHYFYSIFPDISFLYAADRLGLGYPDGWFSPLFIVSDERQAGVYDTVYVDLNYNAHLGDPGERMTKDAPLAGLDLTGDGTWDLSGGMLAWISDGETQPPGVATVYAAVEQYTLPAAGRLLVFITDSSGHGTSCASAVAGQGRITDPHGVGPANPLYAGAGQAGGVGGAVIESVAPGARIAAFQNGFDLPLDAWTLAVLGFDGLPNSGDEAQIVNNSWGDSQTIEDGWDPLSRFAQQLSFEWAPNSTFLVATGNGGHGYGTVTAPGGGPIIDVGASTAYGSLRGFENVTPDQFLYGEVQPWSNRGPGLLGDPAPDVVALGAWGTAALPLNIDYGNGQTAYSIFGGTSLSTPVAAGSLALVYQAFWQQHDRWPVWDEARGIFLNSAQDLGYDVYTQGAGNIQASRAVEIAEGALPAVSPQQWQAGSYRNVRYPAFPAVLQAGATDSQTFTMTNPTGEAVTAQVGSEVFQNVYEETFSIPFSPPAPKTPGLPVYLQNLTEVIEQYQPDLIRAQVALPYHTFDVDGGYYAYNAWQVMFYDWQDRNGNGRLWTDANANGLVDDQEVELDPQTRIAEINRFSYGYPEATVLEASLGKFGLAQRHDGVFFGLSCRSCYYSTTLQVRVSFYKKAGWSWLSLSDPSLSVAPGTQKSFTAHMSIPPDTLPGSYEGAIAIRYQNGPVTILPVTAIVAASSPTFHYGGSSQIATPYDNSHIFGGFNWSWRYEAGDWRFFYYDTPDQTASTGAVQVFDTRWSDPKTDVDVFALGPAAIEAGYRPTIYGPQGLQVNSGSLNTNFMAGKFRWQTVTGTTRELISAPAQEGLGVLALHNILSGGAQLAEGVEGRAFQVTTQPEVIAIEAMPDGLPNPYLSGSQTVTLTTTADLPEGVQVLGYGLSAPLDFQAQTIRQDQPYNLCTASWVYRQAEGGLDVRRAGQLQISTHAVDPGLDIDLFLFEDDGDGRWNCVKDRMVAYTMRDSPEESLKVNFPVDGAYWIVVLGSEVPDGQKPFDISIRAFAGTDISLRNFPIGPIQANQPVDFQVTLRSRYPDNLPASLEGLLFIGLPALPDLIEVPVHAYPKVLLYPQPVLTTGSAWVNQVPVPVHLSITNQGVDSENVQVEIGLPDGLEFAPDSASASAAELVYDPANRKLLWEGVVHGNGRAMIEFKTIAQPGYHPGQAVISATVSGLTSQQTWLVETKVWVNSFVEYLPLIRR